MRTLKNHASRLVGQIGAFGRALGLLIENDDEMALMNLTLLRENPELYRPPLSRALLASHEEIEELLEAHLQVTFVIPLFLYPHTHSVSCHLTRVFTQPL